MNEQQKAPGWKAAGCILCFTAGLVIPLGGLSFLFRPLWLDWNNYDTVHGFYMEPENSIETVFLGSSTVIRGIDPMRMYMESGICAYNLGTEQQPVLASYFWAKEAYRLHSNTLKTVVMDASMLRRVPEKSFYQKALDGMRFSSNKAEAVQAYTNDLNDAISHLIGVFEYHERWTSLDETDIRKITRKPLNCVRGYSYTADSMFASGMEVPVLPAFVNRKTEAIQLNEEAVDYFHRMLDFCREKGLKLVLINTPGNMFFGSDAHNAVQMLADAADVPFLDFRHEPLRSAIGFNNATDATDGIHMNASGAGKLAAYLGKYLMENCGNRDVRGTEGYAYMEEELKRYTKETAVNLNRRTDPEKELETALQAGTIQEEGNADLLELFHYDRRDQNNRLKDYWSLFGKDDHMLSYLSLFLEREGYRIMICAQGDAASALDDGIREAIRQVGFEKLSQIRPGETYIGTAEDGHITEEIRDQDGTTILVAGDGFDLQSGETAEIRIKGVDVSRKQPGLNIVVFDMEMDELISSICFSTGVLPIRTDPLEWEEIM